MRTEPPPWGTTAQQRCDYYRRVCGIPAFIPEWCAQQILAPGTEISAITMPHTLGLSVAADLASTGHPGPISCYPPARRWMFLTEPDLPDDRQTVGLAEANAGIVVDTDIPLPSPSARHAAARIWIVPPISTDLPSRNAVISALRRCAAQR
ncbi:DNA-directed RNA polymerase subunit beta [Nocardia jiangsuensis]|uniref:DNA-directed RNA polymerase subunit beta n=1 Tax=Nocardia jiangsuensis TaxID=1691563 RepID=A0ABV8DWB1_9NOCA